MAPSVFYPPNQLSPPAALALSQQAPAVLRSSPATVSSSPFSALFSASERPELWIRYENLILSCLRTGDDEAAHQCLERLAARFGPDNERVQALRGLVKEAEANHNGALGDVLKEYDQILSENDTNIVRRPSSPLPPTTYEATRHSPMVFKAYREEADRALAIHGTCFRRSVSPRAATRLFSDRCRSLV